MVNTLKVEAGVLAGAILAAAATLVAATPPKAMYEAALAREQAVRETMNDEAAGPSGPEDRRAGPSGPATLKEIRAIENAYLTLVRRHPSSSYCDNALWNAAHLALDAFKRYGEPPDRDTGLHLLGLLVSEYPSSKLARQARDEVAQLGLPAATAGQASAPQHLARVRPELPVARSIATISKVERSVLPDSVRVEIAMDEEVPFHDERLENPPRVFVDFPATRAAATLVDKTLRFDGDNDVVKQIRIGRHENRTTRIVLDTAGVANYSIYALYDPYRLIIDCVRPNSASSRPQPIGPLPGRAATIPQVFKPPPALTAAAVAGTSAHLLPGGTPQSTLELRIAREPGDTISAAPMTPPPALTPPPAKHLGGFSMARQLGLNVSRIVIDPGHGGHDPGAQGRGVTEAEVVLDVALRLEKLLQEVPGVEVILTRRTDDFIPLPERTAIANREGADLFLSIHANASQTASARGIETYFLNFASNLGAAAVAARENAASGQAMAALPDFVKAIALNNKLDESRDFASQVQRAMLDRLRGSHKMIKDLGVKQAPFVVLIGAAMPSVLAEISFVTNPQEAKLLKSGAFRQRIAEALLSGIRKYQTSLHNVTTIAHQGL